jgi:Rrf2 family protein
MKGAYLLRISTKGRYGLQAMLDLALNSTKDHVALGSIAERQGISANYLEQIFSSLKKAGLVKSIKGAQGGYILGDSPSRITVGQILRVLESDLFQFQEDEGEGGKFNVRQCLKISVWDKMQAGIDTLVDNISLEDLKDDYSQMQENSSFMYYI